MKHKIAEVKEAIAVKNARLVYPLKASIQNVAVNGYFKVAEGVEIKTCSGK